MEEFQEIYLSGGKIEFKKGQEGGVSIGYSCANPWPMSMFQLCISFEGEVLGTVRFGGIGQVIPYPQPSLLAWVLSDRHGMFGRQCPNCKTYFRTNICPGDRICPYCGYHGKSHHFLTKNQLKYVSAFCNSFIEAHDGDDDVILDLDKLAVELPENKPQWLYSEEQQQNSYTCACHAKYDILGEYGLCPHCGKSNAEDVFNLKMVEFERQFQEVDEKLTDRHEREVEWEKLTRCVSEFESMANQIRSYMLRFPATPQRKTALRSLTFQNIVKASDCVRDWYGFEMLENVTDVDRRFLNIMFNRRHLFIHNAGRVDQEYLNNSGDTSVRLNQVLRVRSKEIRRLIELVKQCGMSFIKGYASIK